MSDSIARPAHGRRETRFAGVVAVRTGWALASIAGLAACSQNPFATYESDLGPRPLPTRTREVARFDASPYERPGTPEARGLEPPATPFAGAERVPATLEQARAWTLENNLDLRVALVDPVIANQAVSEEEGRYDVFFFTRMQYNNIDAPTATSLQGSQLEDFSIEPGFRVPLRTGGEVEVSLPLNRNETNNAFSTLNPAYASDARFSISQPLLRGAGRRANTHGIRLAAINEQVSLARTKLEVIRQLAAVERSYWRLYASGRGLEVTYQQYELAKEQLERARRLVAAGSAAEVEVIRAEAGVADRVEAIILALNDYRDRQRELKRIINVEGLDISGDALLVTATDPDPVNYEFDGPRLADLAVSERMEMLELELQLAADASTIDFERNQALPLFSVDYTYRVNGLGPEWSDSFNQLQDVDFEDHLVGLNAEVPISNDRARARVEQAVLRRLQRLSSKEARALAIRQETLNAIDAVRADWLRIIAARQSVALNTRTFEAERRQFDVGARTSTDVLDAAARLADAQLAEIRALAEHQIALVDLAFATGTLLGAARVSWEPYDPRGGVRANWLGQPTYVEDTLDRPQPADPPPTFFEPEGGSPAAPPATPAPAGEPAPAPAPADGAPSADRPG